MKRETEGKMRAASSRMVLLAIMLSFSLASAYDFYVGGRDGWVPHPSESFNHWAQRNRFQVYDTLVFRFKGGNDSVLLVKEEDYRSCNTSNPIQKLEESRSVFRLDRSGAFFFIGGAPGRCQQGQKLIVMVLGARGRTGPSPSPHFAPLASPPAVSGSASEAISLRVFSSSFILCSGLLFF